MRAYTFRCDTSKTISFFFLTFIYVSAIIQLFPEREDMKGEKENDEHDLPLRS